MRIITWNCRIGGFRWKAEHIAPLCPDVLAVQEVTRKDEVLHFAGDHQPTFSQRVAGNPAYRGIGVYSYTDTALTPLGTGDGNFGFIRYAGTRRGLEFHVAAVWTYPAEPKTRSYGQALEGIEHHAHWIRQRPTVILGDFNTNASFPKSSIPLVVDLLKSLGLVSAYHAFFGEAFGKETQPTWYQYGKQGSSSYVIDYCFLPEEWARCIKSVEVGRYGDWCGRKLSDHVPLVVDLDLSQLG